ncbi:MAG: hypothetical protein IMZ55_15450 [Acidobacteria bacterium]|nr:hypothetical protein [Acidobacteriota bacterium]
MSDYTQSATQELLAHQEITHPGNVFGASIDCTTWLSAQITGWLANIETTANATGVAFIVQGSIETSGNDWIDLVRFTGSTTAAEAEALTATEPIGETVLALAATANLVVGGLIYILDHTSVAASEWAEIVAVATNASITIMDGLIVAKVADDDVYTQAQRFSALVLCDGLKRLRAGVVHQAATGSDIRVKCTAVGATDIE